MILDFIGANKQLLFVKKKKIIKFQHSDFTLRGYSSVLRYKTLTQLEKHHIEDLLTGIIYNHRGLEVTRVFYSTYILSSACALSELCPFRR